MEPGVSRSVRLVLRLVAYEGRVTELYPDLLALTDRHAWAPSIVGYSSFASDEEAMFTAVYESEAAALGVLGDSDTRKFIRKVGDRAARMEGYLLGATRSALVGTAQALGLKPLSRLSMAGARPVDEPFVPGVDEALAPTLEAWLASSE